MLRVETRSMRDVMVQQRAAPEWVDKALEPMSTVNPDHIKILLTCTVSRVSPDHIRMLLACVV